MKLDRLTSTSLLPRSEAATDYRPAVRRAAVAPVDAPSDATADRQRARQDQTEERETPAAGPGNGPARMLRKVRELVARLARLGNTHNLVRTGNLPPRWHAIDDEA